MKIVSDRTNSSNTIKNWVELYSDTLYSWALHKTSNKETAEDLVQETFLIAVKSFGKFKGESNPKTWLLSILNNKINDHYRSKFKLAITDDFRFFEHFFDDNEHWKIEEMPHPWNDDAAHILDDGAFQKILETCLKKLPENWYSAVQLKYLEEKNGELICTELNISPTNFWQILHRAKLQLRKCLEMNWFKK